MLTNLDFIFAYERGTLESEQEVVDGFQALIDTGMAWVLQGHYGRTAAALIEAGLCTDPRKKKSRPGLVGTFCECGAKYDPDFGGYACAK